MVSGDKNKVPMRRARPSFFAWSQFRVREGGQWAVMDAMSLGKVPTLKLEADAVFSWRVIYGNRVQRRQMDTTGQYGIFHSWAHTVPCRRECTICPTGWRPNPFNFIQGSLSLPGGPRGVLGRPAAGVAGVY